MKKRFVLTVLIWAALFQMAFAYGITKWGIWGSPPAETFRLTFGGDVLTYNGDVLTFNPGE